MMFIYTVQIYSYIFEYLFKFIIKITLFINKIKYILSMLIFLSRDTLQWSSEALILNDLCRRYV